MARTIVAPTPPIEALLCSLGKISSMHVLGSLLPDAIDQLSIRLSATMAHWIDNMAE